MLAGILFVLSEGCRWRAIEGPEASWNSSYQYSRRWCGTALWEKLWERVAPALHGTTVDVEASHVKVHQCGLNPAGGRETQAVGLTKGGWNSKAPVAVEGHAEPRALFLSAGNVADIEPATEVLESVPAKMAVFDKGDDSEALRIWLFARGVTPCLPPKSNRIDPLPYRKASYRKRHLVEHVFQRMKTFRRVATRYDQLAETYFKWLLLATIVKCGM